MYESLVIGRSYSLSWVVGSCYSFEKYFFKLDMCSGRACMDWYILACTKGEINQRFRHVLKGSMDSRMYIKGREYLGLPFALDVKEGEWLGVVVSLKSRIHACSLYTKMRIMYTYIFTEGKVRTCWKTKFWSVVFGPWYFGIGPWYLVRGIDPKYWVQGIGPTWFWTRVLTYIRRRISLGQSASVQGLNVWWSVRSSILVMGSWCFA